MFRPFFSLLLLFSVSGGAALRAQTISNWTAPPDWIPADSLASAGEVTTNRGAEAIKIESFGAFPSSPLPLIAVVPCRIVDTRGAAGPFGGPALIANATRTFNLPAGPCPGIPSDAGAYSLNLTVIGTSGLTGGFLTAWPTGAAQPTVSTLNFNAMEVIANAAVVPAGTSGSINVFVNIPGHLLIDVNGYYRGALVTSVTAGSSLTGGGTGTVTLGVADLGIGTDQLANFSVTSQKLKLPLILEASPFVETFSIRNTVANTGSRAISGASVFGWGVVGFGESNTSIGVVGHTNGGFAMAAGGPVQQSMSWGGWIKGSVRVSGGALNRCFNSQAITGDTANSCDNFSIAGSAGDYTLNFPFAISDRYVVVTPESSVAGPPRCCLVQYNFTATETEVRIRTWTDDGSAADRAFTVVIF
jgi:hypothetical protein